MKLLAAVGIIGLAVGIAAGGPTPAPAGSLPVAELVSRLGSEDFRERESVSAQLEKAGPDAIPALRGALKSDNPEVRQRAAALLLKLQRAADSGEKIAAKKIALNYRGVPIGNAINDFRVRTGLNIAIDTDRLGNPIRKVTCVTGELPIWEAFEVFCSAAGLKEEFRNELALSKVQRGRGYLMPSLQVPSPEAVPITLVDGKPPHPPGDRRTAVRVLVLPRSFPGHRVTLGTGETTLCFDVMPAPGLNWQDTTAVRITRLIDDAGRIGGAGASKPAPVNDSLMDWVGPGGRVVAFGGPAGFNGAMRFDPNGNPLYPDSAPNPRVIPVPLKLATPAARSIKRLEGAVVGEIMLTNQTLICVNDPAKSVGANFDGPGGVRLTVVSITAGNDGTSVQLRLESPAPWAAGARRGRNPGGIWPVEPTSENQSPAVQVYDAGGKLMEAVKNATQINPSDDGQTMMTHISWFFSKQAGPPAKFVVVGGRPMVVEVPFVLENVPLP